MPLGRIGHYELLERIGEGGMGVVFRARDTLLLRIVALKILPERLRFDRAHHERLLHEARALAAVNHPHIAVCYECAEGHVEPRELVPGAAPGDPGSSVTYLAMEYVTGRDLRSVIAGGSPPLPEVLRIAAQIADGVEAAHGAGVIHRDLTPANIRLTPAGEVKILDFGLARSSGRPETRSTQSGSGSHSLAGTIGYMSPEQAAGRTPDTRADLFSFGVILYQMVTGRMPFAGDDPVEVLYAIANTPPHPMTRYAAHVPNELQRIVGKLLEKDPGDRYQSAHEVVTDLRRLRDETSRGASGRAFVPPAGAPPARRGLGRVLGGVAMVVTVLVVGLWPVLVPADRDVRRVAVMEFPNRTGEARFDDLAAGLSADLGEALAQGTDLTVTHAQRLGSAGQPLEAPAAVARELGVGRVVTGELAGSSAGPRLRVSVFGIRKGRQQSRQDLTFAVPGSYASREAIVTELAGALDAHARVRAAGSSRPASPAQEAYEAYLQGLGQFEEVDEPLACERALASFDRALAADSGFALAWAGRSRALLWLHSRAHDPDLVRRASDAAARAVALAPELAVTHLEKARADRAAGRLAQAGAELKAALAVNPNRDDAYRELGAIQERDGQADQAERSYRRAVELRPAYWVNWNRLGGFLLMNRADHAAARAAYEKVIELAPESNRGYEGLGNSYVADARYDDAIAAFRRMPRPVTSAIVASNVANAHFFARQMDAALQYYLLAVSLEPDDPVLRQNLGDCYRRMRRGPEARQQYLESVRLQRRDLTVDRSSPRLRLQMAVCFAKAAECDSAAIWLDAFESVAPAGDAEVLHEAAKAYALCGRRSEAIVALGKMLRAGASMGMLRDEDEFQSLRGDPEFRRLLGGT